MADEIKKEDMGLPVFKRPFSVRVREGWENFLKKEKKLRRLIDRHADSEKIGEQLEKLLSPVFEVVYAEVGFHEGKYDLILNLEGDWSRLFPLTYFKNHAPREVLGNWNILVGRQSREEKIGNYQLQTEDGMVSAEDFQIWTTWEEKQAKVSVYCEKLLPLLQEKEGAAYWIVYTMLDYALGELTEMKYICELEILRAPLGESALLLKQLLSHFMEQLSLSKEELFDAERYCRLYTAYQMKPNEEATDGLRKDVYAGSGCFFPLLNEFWRAESRMMDALHADGIAAGYFCYPLYGFQGEDRGTRILDYRDNMADEIEALAGSDSFTFIGGASGIYYGYIDFIAWDLKTVLDTAVSVFGKSGIDWVMFHSFRQDADGITLFEKRESK
ncbi:MAG: hypothetical protein HDQ96_15840 [Lachnospiraceae bacterium]|nr:hypothetical protein [Lachnospiraceae bacterium]